MVKAFLSLVFSLVLFSSSVFAAEPIFDYTPWHQVLKKYVTEDKGFVKYDQLSAYPEDLDAFLSDARIVSPKTRPELFETRNEQLVFWLQVYNGLAMKNVLNFPGLKKTSDKKLRFFVFSKFEVGEEEYSLRSLENDVIRAEFNDARIHFFLNCASYSCPKLYREPLRADQLDEQLDRFSKNFLNSEQHVRFDAKKGVLYLSMILKWYQVDFINAMKDVAGKKDDKVIAFVNKYRDQPIPRNQIKKIKYIPYNWTVNDVKNL